MRPKAAFLRWGSVSVGAMPVPHLLPACLKALRWGSAGDEQKLSRSWRRAELKEELENSLSVLHGSL